MEEQQQWLAAAIQSNVNNAKVARAASRLLASAPVVT